MGCFCNQGYDSEVVTVMEALADSARYRAYQLNKEDNNHVLTYDFQTNECRIAQIILNPPLDRYSVHINYPLIFTAGGIEKRTNNYSKALWSTSAGGEVLQMTEHKEMSVARANPFIVSLGGDAIYIIGGITKDEELCKVCEKFGIGDSGVHRLPPMSRGSDFIVGLDKSIYAFGIQGARNNIEVLDVAFESIGWTKIVIDDCPITNLDGFGVLGKGEIEKQILIFGGKKKEGTQSKAVFIFDRQLGTIKVANSTLPKQEEFLHPTTSGKQLGFAITKQFEVYKYEILNDHWIVQQTSIIKEKERKGLI